MMMERVEGGKKGGKRRRRFKRRGMVFENVIERDDGVLCELGSTKRVKKVWVLVERIWICCSD